MKEFAVKEIHKGTETSKIDLDALSEQLSNLQQKVRNLYSLEEALKGETGKAIRSFYNEIHTPFITFLLQSMENYKDRLDKMKSDVQSFEPNHQGYISEGFLNDELHPGLDQAKTKVASVSENINSVLSGVSDITYVTKISYSDFGISIEDGKRQIDDVIKDLSELDSKHASKLQETQSDLDKMKKYLSEMTTGLSSGTISISEFDMASLQDMNAYNNVIQQSYGNIEITEDNIEYLPMAAIAAATKNAEKGMDESSTVILGHAYKDLEQGKITRKKYLDILTTITSSKTQANKNKTNENAKESFWEYIVNNKGKILQDTVKDSFHYTLQQLGFETKRIVRYIREKSAIKGPAVPNTFLMYDSDVYKSTQKWYQSGDILIKGSKIIGKSVPYLSAAYGVYDDMTKNKTFGEAVSHNVASLGVGLGSSFMIGLALTNPGGWAILGTVAAGAVISTGFNWLYDNNVFGIQDGLDKVGNAIDDTIDTVKDTAGKVGEAIKDGVESLNPMNWGWGN